MCVQTSSTMGGGILWNCSLRGLLSTTLISCFAKLVQHSSLGSNKKMSWYSANKFWTFTWFASHHPSRQDKSSCWRSTSFLCSINILVHWMPCTSSMPLKFWLPVQLEAQHSQLPLGWFNSLGNSDQNSHQVFHYHHNLFTPRNHYDVCVHYTQAMRQVGSIPSFQNLSHYIHVVFKEHGYNFTVYYFEQKGVYLFPLCSLTASFKLVRSNVCCRVASPVIESSTCQHASKWALLNTFKEADNSLISLSLIMLMIQLMAGVPRVTITWDPKCLVQLEPLAPHHSLKLPLSELLWWHNPGLGEYSSEPIYTQCAVSKIIQRTNIQRMSFSHHQSLPWLCSKDHSIN